MADGREWFGWEIDLGADVSGVSGPEFGSWIERIHPDDAERVAGALREAANGDGGFEAEFRVVRRDGGISSVAAKGVRAGESRLVGVAQEITSKELLQKIVDHIPVMLVLYDPGLNRFELNREAQRVLGWTNEDANEGDFLAKVYPDPAYRAAAAAYMQSLTPGWLEVSPTAKDGSKVASEWANIKLAHDRTIGIGIDVRALRESEERFRTMADNIAPLAWMADASGSVFWYNRRWHEYTGMTLEEAQGWGWRKAQHPEHVERVEERIRHSFETGEPWEDTFPLRGRDEQYRWFLSRALPIRDADDRIARWFGTNTDITDLVEAEERYRGLFESMQEGFHLSEILCDDSGRPVDWRFLAVNPAFERMTGVTRDQAVGRTLRETLAGLDWDFWVRRFGKVALTGSPEQVDGFDGGRYWQSAVYSPRRGQFAAIFTDVTERKRAEAEAARQRQEYETLAENAPEVIARFDSEMRHIYINDYGAKVYGLPKEAILGKTNGELGFPEWHARESMAHFREVCATGTQRTVDFEFESPNLGHQYFSCLFVPEKDADGRVASVLAITRDVTERKQAEGAREELIEQLSQAVQDAHRNRSEREAVLQAMQDGVAVFDMQGRLVFLNQAQVKIGAYPTGEQIPQSLNEFAQVLELRWADGRLVALEDRPVARVLRGESVYDLELTGRRVDTGQEWHFSFSGEPVWEPGGRQALAVIVTRDITDRKRAEERVRQTQKLESVGLLAGGIAHDFNNLLTGILGHASMALEEIKGRPAERVREVMSSAERAANLTRQLLAYSGKGQFVVREIDIAEAVNEIAGLVEFSIPKSAQLAVTVERRLPQVRMDPSQLQQVLMNLVINAGEAIGEGNPGKISVGTSLGLVERRFVDAAGEEVAPGRYVCVDVSDTGSGIEEGKRSKIFDPFFTTKFTGRGLGLAAVSGIVRSLKGGITVESEAGRGTTFRVYLPASEGWVESAPGPSHEETGATILVVDDEAAVRAFLVAVLRKSGYRVVPAADGREALAAFEREGESIAAVVLDVIMPVMGGNDALPKLKAIRPDLKVLLTSGYGELEVRGLCAAYPGAAFIQKPYTAQQVMQAVEGLLEGGERSGAAAGV